MADDGHRELERGQPRKENRLPWGGQTVELAIVDGHSSAGTQACSLRDISREGVALTVPTYLHTGTFVRINVPRHDGGRQDLFGHVRWCEYSNGEHRCGIDLSESIRLENFVPRDLWNEEMLVEDLAAADLTVVHLYGSALDEGIVSLALRRTPIKVVGADSIESAKAALNAESVSVLYIDVAASDLDLSELRDAMNAARYVGAVVMIGDTEDDLVGGRCVLGPPAATVLGDEAATRLLGITATVLAEWSLLPDPADCVSPLSGTPENGPILRSYVEACRTAAEALSQQVVTREPDRLISLIRRVGRTAGPLGFAALGRAATAAIGKLEATGDVSEARIELSRVRELLLAIRVSPDAAVDRAA